MDSHIGYLIKAINDKVKVHADADLKSHNLTLTQSRVLLYLKDHSAHATQKEIEEYLDVSHPTVVGIVSRMEKNGFVVCWFDKNDRRNKNVKLTDMAIQTAQNMDSVISGMEDRMLFPLTKQQISILTQMLELIYKNLD